MAGPFPTPGSGPDLEEGPAFTPRFDRDGLVSAIVVDAADGAVLMLAHMNARALELTIETGVAHFWSRSRQALWRKGETSGNEQRVIEMRTDCDQDAVVLRVEQVGGAACHTGRRSCFYRRVPLGKVGAPMETVDANRRFDPTAVYRKD